MLGRVPLDRIIDNPYQTRREYGDITELAESIRTKGLIQTPPGRIVRAGQVLDPHKYGNVLACLGNEPEAWVELAAGHRRLRAIRQIHEAEGSIVFATMPVDVQPLDDQAMADIAWEENVRRKDLSPIEEAEALRRAMERFEWTQAEVGGRWGLSQSAVANKLRLLQLPEEAQAAIRKGQISERHGRALLKAAGKSERIYELVAEDVIPVAVDEATAEKARVLLEGNRFWRQRWAGDQTCDACGGAAEAVNGQVFRALRDDGGGKVLCWDCYRAATEWSPPSAAEADDLVKVVIRSERMFLGHVDWPLEVAVGEGDPLVQSSTCEGCGLRETEGEREYCLDGRCFKAKVEHWQNYQRIQLEEYLNMAFGAQAPVYYEHGGRDLRAGDEVNVGLVRDGICAPGRCKRLRMRYVNYESLHFIHARPGLPFIYNCNNTNSHNACQRRYLKGLRSEDEVEAGKVAARSAEGRRREAKALMERANLSVGRALLRGHEGAWQYLASIVGIEAKVADGQSVEASASQVAERMLGGSEIFRWVTWEGEAAMELFVKAIGDVMGNVGVGLLPVMDDLTRRLERINGFVLDDEGLARDDLTAEQVAGNEDNLDAISEEAEGMRRDGRASDEEVARLHDWVTELWQALDISREIIGGSGD